MNFDFLLQETKGKAARTTVKRFEVSWLPFLLKNGLLDETNTEPDKKRRYAR